MPVTFICPFCKKHYTAPDTLMGKVAKCPGCGNEFQIPTQGAQQLFEAANFEMFQEAAAADFGAETAPAVATGEVGTGNCPACGAKVPAGSRICVACGHNVFEAVAPGSGEANAPAMHYGQGSSKLAIFLAPCSLALAAGSTVAYLMGSQTGTVAIASVAVPVGVSGMAMLLRQQKTFLSSLAALATVVALIFFILSIMGKHAPAGKNTPPRPTFTWHGGAHGATG